MDFSTPFPRAIAGLVAAAVISGSAWRIGVLTPGGAAAAILIGVAAATGGFHWVTILLVFFFSSVALSRVGRAHKESLAAGRIAKPGARDAFQVFANGGLFAIFAALTPFVVPPVSAIFAAAAAGAIAAATADTWATEIGMLSRSRPRSIITRKVVPPGASGGITALGSAAGIGGAAIIAVLAHIGFGGIVDIAAVLVGGVAGLGADSIIGATLQSVRWCDRCGQTTERTVHSCGTRTKHMAGVPWLDNDGVNALSTAAGAAVAVFMTLWRP